MGVLSKPPKNSSEQKICKTNVIAPPFTFYTQISSVISLVFEAQRVPLHLAEKSEYTGIVYFHHFLILNIENTGVGAKFVIVHFNGEKQKTAKIVKEEWNEAVISEKVESGLFIVNHEQYTGLHRDPQRKKEALQRLAEGMTKGVGEYNLVFNNCEHFCTYIMTGKKFCSQIANWPLKAFAAGAYSSVTNWKELIAAFSRFAIALGQEGIYFVKYILSKCPQTEGIETIRKGFFEYVGSHSFQQVTGSGSVCKFVCRTAFAQILVLLIQLALLSARNSDQISKWNEFVTSALSGAVGYAMSCISFSYIPVTIVAIFIGWETQLIVGWTLNYFHQKSLLPQEREKNIGNSENEIESNEHFQSVVDLLIQNAIPQSDLTG